jgi:hypothetical protein
MSPLARTPVHRRAPGLAVLAGLVVCLHLVLLLAIVRQSVRLQPPSRSAVMARLYHDVAQTAGPGADFFALYHAGVSAGRGRSVYEAGEAPATTPYYYPYRYLPITAQTVGRLAASLRPAAALLLWISITELVLAIFAVAVWRAFEWTFKGLAAVAILLLSAPYWLELYMGQFTFVATTLTCIAVLQRGARAGASVPTLLLTAGSLLKVFPLVVLPALLRSRPARVTAALTVAVVVGTNLPLFVTDSGSGDAFWSKNFLGEPVGLDAGNHGLLYIVYLLGKMAWGDWHLPTWGALTILWRLAVLGATTGIVLRARAARVETSSALLLIAHFISYFQVWEHHMSGAIVAGILLCAGLERSGGTRISPVALLGTAALALPTPFALLGSDTSRWALLDRVAPPLSKAIPLVLLYGVGARALWRGPFRGSTASTVIHAAD